MDSAETSVSDNSNSSDVENLQTITEAAPCERNSNPQDAIPKRGNAHVYVSMIVVFTMIAITAAVVLSLTFSFLSAEEQEDFEHGFQQQVKVITESSGFHAKQVVASMEAMSSSITSFALFAHEELNYSWPSVNLPHFDKRAKRAREDAYLEMIAFSPIVSPHKMIQWEDYTATASALTWLDDKSVDASPAIYPPPSDLALPFWQADPLPYDASLVNFDLLSEPLYSRTFKAMQMTGHPAMSATYYNDHVVEKYFDPIAHDQYHNHHNMHSMEGTDHVDDDVQEGQHQDHGNSDMETQDEQGHAHSETEDTTHHGHRRLGMGDHQEEAHSMEDTPSSLAWAMTRPHSLVLAPVYDSFDAQNRSLTGVLHGILAWEFYLTDLLPPGINGIIAILKNSCGQASTFEIQGPHAEFIGDGDLHDPAYDNLAGIVDFASFLHYDGHIHDQDQCLYSLALYPSREFQDSYASDKTAKFLTLLALVFAFLAIFFFIFVWFVQQRQHHMMGVATRTTAIVTQLFPEEVRDRILAQAEAQAKKDFAGDNQDEEEQSIKNLLGFSTSQTHLAPTGTQKVIGGIKVLEDAPIADQYQEVTVFFGDLVGFTKWSSNRAPQDVFLLLETLYGEFDTIARRRRVFKVETIGDCYVAVVGLPKKRRDHAVVMARFAWDCLTKSSVVFNALADRLGDDTRDLNLRVGLHSGPVTAGVLRGEKGRFQIFGDTVNTAARMESSSWPDCIHCSKSTADLLCKAGKDGWITERSDKIVAKGKGEMTTYWIAVQANSGRRSSKGSWDSSQVTQSLAHDDWSATPYLARLGEMNLRADVEC